MNLAKTIVMLALLPLIGCDQSARPIKPVALQSSTIDSLPSMMEAYGVDGMVISVVAEDQRLLSKGYGMTIGGEPFTPDTPCSIYSATKAISSITLASMLEDQVFDINTPLGDYIIDAPEAWQDIPFWRLLNHTTGIPMIINRPEFSDMEKDPDMGNRDIYYKVKTEPLDYVPGTYSRYRQSGYAIAEMIYADKLGQDWHDLISAHLTIPAGTKATFNPKLESGERNKPFLTSAGGFQSTANDMVKVFKALNSGDVVDRHYLETLLYTPKYNFKGYSLASLLSEVNSEPTVGHRGGGRANIRYAPQSGVGVFVCTDDRSNKEIMVDVAEMLMLEVLSGKPAATPIQLELYALTDQPAKTVIKTYNEAKNSNEMVYDFSRAETVLNGIGYSYLAKDELDDAIEIFKLNVREFPTSGNAYDSLGEAFRVAGNITDAIKNYEEALKLVPNMPSGKKALEEMRANGK